MAPAGSELHVECEHCGHEFDVVRPGRRRVDCPQCGRRTLVPFRRAPTWFLVLFAAALSAIAVPGVVFRLAGPSAGLAAAVVTIAAVWWFGRRL